MADDKYTLFKNFMHNELKITKEDIERWTKEAVTQVAEKYVKNNMESGMDRQIVNRALNGEYGQQFVKEIRSEVASVIANRLILDVKPVQVISK